MSCFGDDCHIVTQEARNVRFTNIEMGDACSPEQVGTLQRRAEEKILKEATLKRGTCPHGCRCVPKKGAIPDETDWEPEPVSPFTLVEGTCKLTIHTATVETRIVRTPGICKEWFVKIPSSAAIREGIELIITDASVLTREKLDKVREVLS